MKITTIRKFDVKIYYSGFCSYQIKASDENEAIEKARIMGINEKEIMSNLENWKEADTAEKLDQCK